MKMIRHAAALALLAAPAWGGCSHATPNCDAYVSAAETCCAKATDETLKKKCQDDLDLYQQITVASAEAVHEDCPEVTYSCPYP
jgi:hypothetical protein